MAEFRNNVDPMSWLTSKADDTAVGELDKGTLDILEHRYGSEMLPDMVEYKLSASGVDFATASDEQIFDATNELVDEAPEQVAEADESQDGGEYPLPSDEEMVEEIVQGIFEDPEFRAALDGQWQDVPIPSDQLEQVVEEVVGMIKEGLWDGMVAAMAEVGDTEPADPPSPAEIDQAMQQITGV